MFVAGWCTVVERLLVWDALGWCTAFVVGTGADLEVAVSD